MAALAAVPDRVAACAAELIVSGSLEMNPDRRGDAAVIAALLPAGTRVYVNHLPRHGLLQSLAAITALREVSLDPVPHLAARRIASREELTSFLEEAAGSSGVSKVLLIGGDDPDPRGPYPDAAALLRDGVLGRYGIREVGLPGYPEGHPWIPRAALERSLADKLALAAAQGLNAYVVTQFSFAPARVVEYCSQLARNVPAVPVWVGMAGPSDAVTLIRFAQRCGVSASLRALEAEGMGAIRLFTHTDPSDQLVAVARYCLQHPQGSVVGVHLFSFGAARRSAEWLNGAITA